jgi:hypothetical protein
MGHEPPKSSNKSFEGMILSHFPCRLQKGQTFLEQNLPAVARREDFFVTMRSGKKALGVRSPLERRDSNSRLRSLRSPRQSWADHCWVPAAGVAWRRHMPITAWITPKWTGIIVKKSHWK